MADTPASDTSEDFYADNDMEMSPTEEQNSVHITVPSQSPKSDAIYDESSADPKPHTIKRRLDPEDALCEPVKRQRLTLTGEKYFSSEIASTLGLSAEVWQHVFLNLAQDDLCRCLRVNRAFNTYLTSLNTTMSVQLPPRRQGLQILDSDSIWHLARRHFAPSMPRPLNGFGEMQMIQLLGGRFCQQCGTLPSSVSNQTSSLFQAGPGTDGVRIIWSFFSRLCGNCFEAVSIKDVELLVSPAAPLRAGLPHAFRTNDLHYIPATVLQAHQASAPKGAMSKVYSRKHIEELQRDHLDAKELGEAAAEEWVKGLVRLGKGQMADCARWERFETSHPPGTNLGHVLREYFRPSPASPVDEVSTSQHQPISAASSQSQHSLPTTLPVPMKHPLPARVVAADPVVNASSQPSQPIIQPNMPPLHFYAQPQQPQALPPHTQQVWRPRNQYEAEAAKAARKADIERRCVEEFDPPISPEVLQHMESFRAALVIPTPLTESAWKHLKERLSAQRDAAEQIEWQKQEQMRALQATLPDPSYRDSFSKGANEVADKQWESAQAPIRKQLGKYADEFVRLKYSGGKSLSRESCPAFAVEVLLYARNKFVKTNEGSDTFVGGDVDRTEAPDFVSLENMRWLFDNKVKPLTEKHCRELFICAECDGVPKGYAFEGLMQHYGAKHTSDFSKGNIVVHWQTAEWPEEPPFIPTTGEADPTIPEVLAASTSASYSGSSAYAQPTTSYDNSYGYNTSHINAGATNVFPAPAAGRQPYQQDNAQWAPATADYSHLLPQILNSYGQGRGVTQGYPGSGFPYQAYQSGTPAQAASHSGQTTQYYGLPLNDPAGAALPEASASATPAPISHQPPAPTKKKHDDEHMNKIAKTAKKIWDTLAGIKDLFDSIRIHTILHHVVVDFRIRFGNEPSLELVTDAVASHVLLKPFKSANRLACKTCISSTLDGSSAYKLYPDRIADSKLYNLATMMTHFKVVHLQGDDEGLDWKQDMIEMPEDDMIRDLIRASGMTDEKLTLIAHAFPGVFPDPLPQVGLVMLPKTSPKTETIYENLSAVQRNQQQALSAMFSNSRQESLIDQTDAEQSDALPEAGEDEYDPRRPAFLDVPHTGRRASGRQSPASIDFSALEPRTLAALTKLGMDLGLEEQDRVQTKKPNRALSIPHANNAAPRVPPEHVLHPDDPYLRGNQPALRARHPRNGRRSGSFEKSERAERKAERRAAAKERDHSRANALTAPKEPMRQEEDYTQIIRTPASGPYESQTLSAFPPAASYPDRNARPSVDQYGRPLEPHYADSRPRDPRAYSYEHVQPQPQYVDEYGHPIAPPQARAEERFYVDELGRVVPAPAPQPVPETRYVDQFGRIVEVVRVVERPVYDHYQHEYGAPRDPRDVRDYSRAHETGYGYQHQQSHPPPQQLSHQYPQQDQYRQHHQLPSQHQAQYQQEHHQPQYQQYQPQYQQEVSREPHRERVVYYDQPPSQSQGAFPYAARPPRVECIYDDERGSVPRM